MPTKIQIRLYRAADLPGVDALEARVKPYRPEDQTEVQAMFARAAEAERQRDPAWLAQQPHHPASPESYVAFWVAEQSIGEDEAVIVGTVAVQHFRAGEEMAPTHPLAQTWDSRQDVIELRRVRVDPEVRGQGVGRQLCQAAIDWARTKHYTLFVVNSTTPQVPALRLYRNLGFQDTTKSFIGQYELQWLTLDLI
ncbi:GNAT family N-acetyltransferase [Chloroflexi bacterium TSY]|nr:GNAT family N-acetyltransferase [Chloroflexi bacterium TSY]